MNFLFLWRPAIYYITSLCYSFMLLANKFMMMTMVRWSWSSWNVWHSGTNEWKDETSRCREGIPVNKTTLQKRTCKDRSERTRHKVCRHQLNAWAWKNDEKVRWKYQPDREDSCTCDKRLLIFFYDQRRFASQVEKREKTPISLICSLV